VAAGPLEAARSRPPAVSERPDRALYEDARKAEATLKANRRLQERRSEWDKVALKYRRVVQSYPQSPYCDNALLAAGDLYRDMAGRFGAARYADDAVSAYRALVDDYPSSSLGEQALWNAVAIMREGGDQRRVADAAKTYLAAFPDSPRAKEVKALIRRKAPAQAAVLPKAPPPGLAQVFKLRFWSGETSTRIVLDVERELPFRHDRIGNPERLWIDLQGARLHPSLSDHTFPVGDGLLEQVRVGQNKDDVVRIVLDFRSVKDYKVFYLADPVRLVIDVQGAARPMMATSDSAPTTPPPPTPRSTPVAVRPEPVPSPSAEPLPQRRLPVLVAGASPKPSSPAVSAPAVVVLDSSALEAPPARPSRSPSPSPSPSATSLPTPASSPTLVARTSVPEAPAAPQPNRSGAISLARQLGLGARRIVIDAGHGGHDPGTIGHGGLQEKDLVLDVALRLERLLRSEVKAEVVMTRATDVFIPLEERTAIANSKGADLFLSIHANASPNRQARGIETYFLNFAKDARAQEVAARENAISAATLKDLQGLVKAITINSKIDESRDFAALVQESLAGGLKAHDPDVENRGVHTAPFYVLIGANMPSILAEIAFVSNPAEERKLRDSEYRDHIARNLLVGVTRYLEALNRTQLRQLTRNDERPATPASRTRRR
jgi:N-acetylmuramoyl-L-alanine amidase